MYLILILISLIIGLIFLRKFNIINIHTVLLFYIGVVATCILLNLCTQNMGNWFHLFNFEYLYSLLHLPITTKIETTVEIPINAEIKDLLIVLNKNIITLNSNVELLLKEQKVLTEAFHTLLEQGKLIGNSQTTKLNAIIQNTGNLKSGISALQSSLDGGFKNINISLNTFNERSQEMRDVLSYMSNISAKNLESLYTLNNQFLVSSAELSKINSTLVAHQDVTTNGFTALHKALETSAGAQADLQQQLDLVKQRQTDLNYKNYVENQKLAKELESFKAETRTEIEAGKPKVIVTETKVSSSWFNSLFSDKPKA